jgi:hypothetical protein
MVIEFGQVSFSIYGGDHMPGVIHGLKFLHQANDMNVDCKSMQR